MQGNEAAAKAVMALPNLRCEFKVKKGGTFLATDLRLTNNFLITADVYKRQSPCHAPGTVPG